MYFYEFIFVTLFIHALKADVSSNTGVEKVSPDSGGIFFFITFNNTSIDDYNVEVFPGDCKITGAGGYINRSEACKCIVPAGQTKTIKLKASIPDTSTKDDRCWIYVNFKSYKQKNIREIVKIIFHVSLLEGNKKVEIITINCDNIKKEVNRKHLAECNKVIAKEKHYKNTMKNCINAPSTVDTNDVLANNKVLSNSIIAHAMVKRDTQEKSKVDGDNNEKNKVSLKTVLTNTTEPFGLTNTKDVCPQTTEKHVNMKHKKIIHPKNLTLDQSVYKYLKQYRWITALLAAITIIQCILIFTICMRRKCQCFGDKRVISHFFKSYQQDSVTTPLISTSVIDINNLKNQFISESSTNTPNLKSYKACGKDKSENTKLSMSDDILSKFINRRDWKNHYKNCTENETNHGKDENGQIARVHTKHKDVDENISEDNVLQEKKTVGASEEQLDREGIRKEDTNSSNREGKYHSFSCYNTQVEESSFEKNPATNDSKASSTEKAAQTYFPKDSIDAILSERNIYLADENLSKYTLSSDTGKNKSTEILNKASKNIVKYFNTLLHKRSRHGSHSDPGKDKDLKMLHMSEASLYSSNDSEEVSAYDHNDQR